MAEAICRGRLQLDDKTTGRAWIDVRHRNCKWVAYASGKFISDRPNLEETALDITLDSRHLPRGLVQFECTPFFGIVLQILSAPLCIVRLDYIPGSALGYLMPVDQVAVEKVRGPSKAQQVQCQPFVWQVEHLNFIEHVDQGGKIIWPDRSRRAVPQGDKYRCHRFVDLAYEVQEELGSIPSFSCFLHLASLGLGLRDEKQSDDRPNRANGLHPRSGRLASQGCQRLRGPLALRRDAKDQRHDSHIDHREYSAPGQLAPSHKGQARTILASGVL
jgi:hypothetical protein